MSIIGLDIGTTSVCGVLTDETDGHVIRALNVPNDAWVKSGEPCFRLQDPQRLLAVLSGILADLTADGGVRSIGVTGQMHGIVYLAADGTPLGPLAIWQDGRGDLPYRDGLTYAQYMTKQTGYPLATGYGLVTHFFNTVNHAVPAGAVGFCTIHDLTVMALTGRQTPLLHPSDAASLGLFRVEENRFDEDAIRSLGMDPAFCPAVANGCTAAGTTKDGIPVAVAVGDNQASFLGSVRDAEGGVLVNIGTGGQISCAVGKFVDKAGLDCRPLDGGACLLAGSSLCGGRSYAILERFLRQAAQIVTGTEIESAYPAMDRVMESAADSTLTVETTFCGTRADPSRRGAITGITEDNLTVADLCGAFLDGMTEELCAAYREMSGVIGKRTQLVGSGNGIRRNRALIQRFEKAFGMKMQIPVHREEAAYGAALCGAAAAGVKRDLHEARKLIQYQ